MQVASLQAGREATCDATRQKKTRTLTCVSPDLVPLTGEGRSTNRSDMISNLIEAAETTLKDATRSAILVPGVAVGTDCGLKELGKRRIQGHLIHRRGVEPFRVPPDAAHGSIQIPMMSVIPLRMRSILNDPFQSFL